MFWKDIAEIKEWMNRLTDRLVRTDLNVEKILGYVQENSEKCLNTEQVQDCLIDLRDAFCPDDEYSLINRIHDKLNSLINDERKKSEVDIAIKTLDKLEDYMKNVDKLNAMINEFKGCISMSRGALEEKKKVAEKESETVNLMLKIAEILRKQEKKSLKKRKSVKKKAAAKAPVSE